MSKVENGNTVSVHYRGTLENGTEFDNSRARGETLSFQVGSPGLLAGFSSGVVGMAVGEVKTVNVAFDEAYGPRNEEALQTIPKDAFPPEFEFVVGTSVQGNQPNGQPVTAKICSDDEDSVVLDFNHPLAGEDLTFEIELIEIA
ncbi:MAG TPA: peptidylprolyl isomerase [Flavobacteriales bacterium]|jgi:peptidylprolyl isomerase|nr:peptidylprolyl isomerase [Flavobacteriales bacterium]